MSYEILPGIDGFTDRTPYEPVSPARRKEVDAWFAVWHSLTPAQQDAWQRLTRVEKDASYKMTAAEFAAFMAPAAPIKPRKRQLAHA